jgi:trans-2,3-dihydro-3-hydroxyanthranilate isomerase
MRNHLFYQLDVFTRTPFEGNPLAVFPEGNENLSGEEMQVIAREMNLSETVFVLPSEKALRRLRIFTPRQELPLAGHPVVGTWHLLAGLGITPKKENGTVRIEHELNLGVLPVEIDFKDGAARAVVMTQGAFEAGAPVTDEKEIQRLAEGLGLPVGDLNFSENLPVQTVSTGIRALAVPVCSLETLGRIHVNSGLLTEIYTSHGAIGCYVFTFETKETDSRVHARFFAPGDNIPEDPATGSAAGSLSGYLVHHGAVEAGRLTIEQGDFMARPSRIHSEVEGREGLVERVKIGGTAVVVAKGEIFF